MKKSTFNNPDSQEREYTRLLLGHSKQLQSDINAILMPQIGKMVSEFNSSMKSDSWVDDLRMLINQLAALGDLSSSLVISKLHDQFSAVSKFNEGQFKLVVKANTGLTLPPVMAGAPTSTLLGVNVFRSEPFIAPLAEAWVAENTALIKSIKTPLHSAVESIIQRGAMNGLSVKDIKDQIKDRFNVTDYRAKLIAQDQTLKLNADLTRYRVQSVGVKKYIWRTVADNRVRPEHTYRNGNTYTFKDGAGGENPGEPVRCRCRIEAVFDDGQVSGVENTEKANKPISDEKNQEAIDYVNKFGNSKGIEAGHVRKENGDFVLTKLGDKNSITFTEKEIESMNGCVLVHSHPSLSKGDNASLSFGDFNMTKPNRLKEIQAVTGNGIIFRGSSIGELSQYAYGRAVEGVKGSVAKLRANGLGDDEINSLLGHALNIGLKNKKLVNYAMEKSTAEFDLLIENHKDVFNGAVLSVERSI